MQYPRCTKQTPPCLDVTKGQQIESRGQRTDAQIAVIEKLAKNWLVPTRVGFLHLLLPSRQ